MPTSHLVSHADRRDDDEPRCDGCCVVGALVPRRLPSRLVSPAFELLLNVDGSLAMAVSDDPLYVRALAQGDDCAFARWMGAMNVDIMCAPTDFSASLVRHLDPYRDPCSRLFQSGEDAIGVVITVPSSARDLGRVWIKTAVWSPTDVAANAVFPDLTRALAALPPSKTQFTVPATAFRLRRQEVRHEHTIEFEGARWRPFERYDDYAIVATRSGRVLYTLLSRNTFRRSDFQHEGVLVPPEAVCILHQKYKDSAHRCLPIHDASLVDRLPTMTIHDAPSADEPFEVIASPSLHAVSDAAVSPPSCAFCAGSAVRVPYDNADVPPLASVGGRA